MCGEGGIWDAILTRYRKEGLPEDGYYLHRDLSNDKDQPRKEQRSGIQAAGTACAKGWCVGGKGGQAWLKGWGGE